MPLPLPSRRTAASLLIGAAVVLFAMPVLIEALAGDVLRSAARSRGVTATWERLGWQPPLTFELRGLTLVRFGSDTLCRLNAMTVGIDAFSLLALHPRPARFLIAHARLRLPSGAATDSLAPPDEIVGVTPPRGEDRSARVRSAAGALVRVLLLPARRWPAVELTDITVYAGDDSAARAHLSWLSLSHAGAGSRLAAAGTVRSEQVIPFSVDLSYDDADRLTGGARFLIPDAARGAPDALAFSIDGRLEQDRRRGVVTLGDSTRLDLGPLSARCAARLDRAGPRLSLCLDFTDLSAARLRERTPAPLLGALTGLAVHGSFDYHASFDLDLAQPDSVSLEADVVPHNLALDPMGGSLHLAALAAPFTAEIHLPHDHIVTRELSSANAHFLALGEIDSTLVHAVLTNEDGGFFRHRGFNTEAIRRSIADNIHAAAWRRGAGTITMQLVRNLYLGHDRTLSRKAREVVLAWVLEHLSGVSKDRMLEIYLNIVEWGDDVCGADEASRFYFGHGARSLTVSEALFLATVLPSPAHWHWRVTSDGNLRPYERAQMQFIGRAMERRGWLAEGQLPGADSLRIELRGPAWTRLPHPAGYSRADSLERAFDADSAGADTIIEPALSR
jgi:hypothetical protein